MVLSRMINPLTRDLPRIRKRPLGAKLFPEQAFQVVAYQLLPFDPALWTTTMHYLHELEREAWYQAHGGSPQMKA